MATQEQNREGKWVPAIPEPYYLKFRVECECGRKFWSKEAYRGHYALRHILNLNK